MILKKCPECNRTYADESISFCLADGTLLSAPFDSNVTLINSDNPNPLSNIENYKPLTNFEVIDATLKPEEIRLHNEARRYARLVVTEIEIYNREQLELGRKHNDLYDRLKDELRLSKNLYDRRVPSQVRERFDYFFNEVVNRLCNGDISKLGKDYPSLKT